MFGAGSVEASVGYAGCSDVRSKRATGATSCRGRPSGQGGKVGGWGYTFGGMILTTCGFLGQPTLLEETQRYLRPVCESGLVQGFDFNQGNLTGKKGPEGCG
jgi:hypothetical protein